MALIAPTRSRVELRPIRREDVPAVAAFLHAHHNSRVPVARWERAAMSSWDRQAPNHGFMLVAEDTVVGAHLAIYSRRTIDGRSERFCNLAAFCVLAEHRLQALRLLRALLAQDGFHFTDLSPSGNVPGLNERLGFERLDTATVLVPNLPWPTRGRVTCDRARIRRALTGRDLELYQDHADAPAAVHVLLSRGDEHCYVILRRDRRKRLPLFATVVHVGNPDLFRRMTAPLGRHLLLRHGIPVTLLERAVTDHRPRLSASVAAPRPRMFKSPSLDAARIDYLYSELVCLSW